SLLETLKTVCCLSIRREERGVADRTGPPEFHSAHIRLVSLNIETLNFNPECIRLRSLAIIFSQHRPVRHSNELTPDQIERDRSAKESGSLFDQMLDVEDRHQPPIVFKPGRNCPVKSI